jgi:hypothetical protein
LAPNRATCRTAKGRGLTARTPNTSPWTCHSKWRCQSVDIRRRRCRPGAGIVARQRSGCSSVTFEANWATLMVPRRLTRQAFFSGAAPARHRARALLPSSCRSKLLIEFEFVELTGAHGNVGEVAWNVTTGFTRQGSQVRTLHRPPKKSSTWQRCQVLFSCPSQSLGQFWDSDRKRDKHSRSPARAGSGCNFREAGDSTGGPRCVAGVSLSSPAVSTPTRTHPYADSDVSAWPTRTSTQTGVTKGGSSHKSHADGRQCRAWRPTGGRACWRPTVLRPWESG